ncbi:MAG: glycosyltransferase family 4 protein [Dehalococcoidia bacterium]|nr:glycosyltransferase family 4 protein [Dehalococcoidia bacterium]
MKIALVSPYDYAYPGGVTIHVSRLQDQFQRMGHVAKIIAPCSREEMGSEDVYIVGKPVPIPASGSICRISISPMLTGKVKSILQQERFDIIHMQEPLLPALPVTVLRCSHSVNVGTFHAFRNSSWGYRYWKPLLKRYFRKLHGKIAVSVPAQNFISKYFPGYYNIIPNGIDVAHFTSNVPKLEQYCDGKLNILFVGRLEKRKGLIYLLEAYRKIKKEMPDTRLIIVGPGGGLQQGYERFVYEYKLPDVVFTGFCTYEDLPRYYHTAHVFCAPAFERESFGIILLEAMASGTPIIASNTEGYAGVIDGGDEAVMVEPRSVESLADALLRVLPDKELRARMGSAGRLKAERFDWSHISARLIDYYNGLLSEVPYPVP